MPNPPGSPDLPRDYSLPAGQSKERLLEDEYRRAVDSLKLFADETGGRALIHTNDMDDAFRRVVDENSAYYILGYQSPDARRDGRYHRVSVRVKRPDLEVRFRKGYHAPIEGKAKRPLDAINQMLSNPAPVTGLGMRANAAVIKGLLHKSTVHLTVELNGKDIPLRSAAGFSVNDVELKYVAVTMKGEQQAARREIAHLQLKPATLPGFPQHGMRWVTEFELPPGRYQLRMAAHEQLTGRTGSVFADIEVPDFAAAPFAMSDLLITTTSAPKTVMGISASNLGTLLPTPTTTVREFSRDDTLSVLAAFYDTQTTVPHTVDLRATVQSDAGARVFLREESRDGRDLKVEAGGYRWPLTVPFAGLSPGRYILIVEGRSRLASAAPAKREMEFRIR
jgi:hypothetical protein